jgi:hypothetical protein
MLDEKQKDNPCGVETFFCKVLADFDPQALTKEQTKIMIALQFSQGDDLLKFEQEVKKIYWFYDGIDKRIKAYFTYDMDIKAKIILCSWCKSIGDMVIYLTYIQYLCKKYKIKHVNSDVMCMAFFPMGIFSDEIREKAWKVQKIKQGDGYSDNLLDYGSAYYSILFK